ncbi:MAG: ATP-dependent protease ATPase subunit HslU [Alphaproteobacteria bacterium]|nr:ATP-dependent protease ATPase subunit HslU [Rickettsiales bacterium]
MDYTPKEIVDLLNRSVVGQDNAKRALAIALRNRYRITKIPDQSLMDKTRRKNILFVGPTGVGKTELVTCACNIDNAPFVKSDATKFTEVGYVGRDVESIIQDLIERSISIQKKIRSNMVNSADCENEVYNIIANAILKKLNIPVNIDNINTCIADFKSGVHDDLVIEVQVPEKENNPEQLLTPIIDSPVNAGSIATVGVVPFGDFFKAFSGHKEDKIRRLNARKAFNIILDNKRASKVDEGLVVDAMKDAQKRGVVFIDEIDKLVNSKTSSSRGDVSREGVQRDLLPIVEGTVVQTKYGPFDTKQVLFVSAGAFHSVKPADLLTELQGRFPIRVNFTSLTTDDFIKILTVPEFNIITQIKAILNADGVDVVFYDDSIKAIAEYTTQLNSFFENTGARRLYSVLETVIEEISFNAPSEKYKQVIIDKKYIDEKMKDAFKQNSNKKDNHII